MILTIVLTGIFIILSQCAIAGAVFLYLRGEKQKLVSQITTFFTAPAPDTLSPFALTMDNIGNQFGKHIVGHIKTSFMGLASVDSRNQKAIEGELITGAAESQSPVLAAILANFPGIRKRLTKNPSLAPMVLEAASKIFAGGKKVPDNGSGSFENPFKF